jgi:hypothetical protein
MRLVIIAFMFCIPFVFSRVIVDESRIVIGKNCSINPTPFLLTCFTNNSTCTNGVQEYNAVIDVNHTEHYISCVGEKCVYMQDICPNVTVTLINSTHLTRPVINIPFVACVTCIIIFIGCICKAIDYKLSHQNQY